MPNATLKKFPIGPIIISIAMSLLALGITANRTWNHIYMGDPFMGRVALEAETYHPIILLGDSVIGAHFKTDKDRRTVSELLAVQTGLPVLNAARSGLSLSAQEQLLELIALKSPKAQVLILEINPKQMMRKTDPIAFAEWKKHIALIKSNMPPTERFLQYTLYLDKKMGHSGNTLLKSAENLSIANATEDLLSLNALLSRVLRLSSEIATHTLCFITPTDMARVQRESSPKELEERSQMIADIKAICEELNTPCLDLHEFIQDSKKFPDVGYIDIYHVHLDDAGRHALVEKLAEALTSYGYIGHEQSKPLKEAYVGEVTPSKNDRQLL